MKRVTTQGRRAGKTTELAVALYRRMQQRKAGESVAIVSGDSVRVFVCEKVIRMKGGV